MTKGSDNKKFHAGKRKLPGQFYTLTFKIVSYVFILTVITLTIALGLMAALYYAGLFDEGSGPTISPVLLLVLLVLCSSLIGCGLSVALYSLSFKSLNQFRAAMNKVAKGDFTVTLPDSEDNYMHDLNSSFNAMVRSLGSIETLKTNFISDFSHEFKTPIASICGFAKLLKDPDLAEEDRQEYINIIIAESNRLTQLSKNTLSMSKLENQETVYEKKIYRLDEQLRKCALMFQPETDGKRIELSLVGDDVDYFGSEDLTQQMWINLISNAVKFTPESGSIEITVRKEDGSRVVSVRDSGIGMDEETRRHIFDKFYQGDASRSVAGNGLGLAIVRRIVQITGGRIDVDSRPGEGSTFTVTLPDERPDDQKEGARKQEQRTRTGVGLFRRSSDKTDKSDR